MGVSGEVMSAFEFFRDAHRGQRYQDGTPYWVHLFRVGFMLDQRLCMLPAPERRDVAIAGFGHDCLEDTSISKERIAERFGSRVLGLICDVTNWKGDDDVSEYVEQVCAAGELSRIIKLVDMWDNYASMCYRSFDNRLGFFEDRVFPVMEPMFERIVRVPFETQAIGNALIAEVVRVHDRAQMVVRLTGEHDAPV